MLTAREGSALSDLDNVAVRIADVAANVVALFRRLRDELRSSIFPNVMSSGRSVSFDLRREFVNYCRTCLAHDFVLGIRASGTTNCADDVALIDQWNTASRANDSIERE